VMEISNTRFDNKGVQNSSKGFLVKVPPMILLSSTKIGCLNLSLEEVMVVDLYPRSNCTKSERNHGGKGLASTDGCYGCGKSGHQMRGFSMLMAKGIDGKQATPSGLDSNAPKQNRFYAFHTRGEQESSPDVLTAMLKVFQLDVYALLDPGATLSFVTPYVLMRFDVLPDVLIEPFSVSTPIGDSIVAKRVYRKCPVSLSHRVTLVDLVELDMLDFDVILSMDWLHSCYASIDCRTRLIKFEFPNEPILEEGRKFHA